MKTTSLILSAVFVISITCGFAQSKTTDALQKKTEGSVQSLFFYHNTLSMFNQSDNKEFDELIKDIEKMKFLMIKKTTIFGDGDYKTLVSDYKKDAFEEAMTSRIDGKNFDVFIKGTSTKTKGMLVLVNDSEMLYVLDIVGSIAFNKAGSLFKTLEGSSDFENILKGFTKGKDDKHGEDDEDNDDHN
jgi:hypothetical protein